MYSFKDDWIQRKYWKTVLPRIAGEGLQQRIKSTPSPDEEQPCDLRLITTASVFKELVSIAASLPPPVPPPPPSLAAITAQTSVVGSTYAAGIAAAVAAVASPASNLPPRAGTTSPGTGMQPSPSLQPPPPHHSPLQSVKFQKIESLGLTPTMPPAGIPATTAPLASPLINFPIKSSGASSGGSSGGNLAAGSSSGSGGGGWGAFTCQRCGNSYARPHSLNRHIRFECGVEPKFECPICHKKSKHKHNLVLHMRTHQNR